MIDTAPADQAAMVAAMSPLARELVELLRFEGAMTFFGAFKGQRLYVPVRATPEHRITRAIGMELAVVLCGRFGKHQVEVPTLIGLHLMLRDNAIRADFDAGARLHDLVDRYRMTQGRIRRILAASTSTSPRLPG